MKSFFEQFPEMECFRKIIERWYTISRNNTSDEVLHAVLQEFNKSVDAINGRQQLEVAQSVMKEDSKALSKLADGVLPAAMIRPSDKEEFVLDESRQKYTNRKSLEHFPTSLHHYYSLETLKNHGFYAKDS